MTGRDLSITVRDTKQQFRTLLRRRETFEGGYGGIFGTFFVCGLTEDSFCSLTPEQMEHFKKKFHQAEILVGTRGNEAVTLKVEPQPHTQPDQPKRPPKTPGR